MRKATHKRKWVSNTTRWASKRKATAFPEWILNTYVPYFRWFKQRCRELASEDAQQMQVLVAYSVRDAVENRGECFTLATEKQRTYFDLQLKSPPKQILLVSMNSAGRRDSDFYRFRFSLRKLGWLCETHHPQLHIPCADTLFFRVAKSQVAILTQRFHLPNEIVDAIVAFVQESRCVDDRIPDQTSCWLSPEETTLAESDSSDSVSESGRPFSDDVDY